MGSGSACISRLADDRRSVVVMWEFKVFVRDIVCLSATLLQRQSQRQVVCCSISRAMMGSQSRIQPVGGRALAPCAWL